MGLKSDWTKLNTYIVFSHYAAADPNGEHMIKVLQKSGGDAFKAGSQCAEKCDCDEF